MVFTSHNLLALRASRMSIINVETCRKCREGGMTLSRIRLRYLGASQFKGLEEVSKLDIKSLLNFAKNVDVLHDVNFCSY